MQVDCTCVTIVLGYNIIKPPFYIIPGMITIYNLDGAELMKHLGTSYEAPWALYDAKFLKIQYLVC